MKAKELYESSRSLIQKLLIHGNTFIKKTEIVSFKIDDKTLRSLDSLAKKLRVSRSFLIRSCISLILEEIVNEA